MTSDFPTSTRNFALSDFDFEMPPELIAQHPATERSGSRLLDGSSATVVDRIFHELPGLLQAGDLLVFNDTKVVKARIFGEKASGGKLELLIERVLPGHQVVAHHDVLAGAVHRHVEHLLVMLRLRLHLCFAKQPHAMMQRHRVMMTL